MAILSRGERFKEARLTYNQHNKQTMKEVETATGVSASLIQALEDDENTRSVGYDKVALLANHYGVTSDWLLCLTEDPAIKPCAADVLGLRPLVIDELVHLCTVCGFYDGDDTRDTPLQAFNVLAYNSLKSPIYEMICALRRAILYAEDGNYQDEEMTLVNNHIGERQNIKDIHIENSLYDEILKSHPFLRDKIKILYGSSRFTPMIDEICHLFRSIVEGMTGYTEYIYGKE